MNNDLISRSALLENYGLKNAMKYGNETVEQQHNSYSTLMLYEIAEMIEDAPAVDAEPVRHEGNTTFITTENLEDYADRIIVGQGTFCKVYYGDEPERYGRWIRHKPNGIIWTLKCSECGWVDYRVTLNDKFNYCPNCGAKMDKEE